MRLLFKGKYYPVNSGVWTLIKYRFEYCQSVYDMTKDDKYIENLLKLLYISIEGEEPSLHELTEEAMRPESHLLQFCNSLFEKLMKNDKILDKYIQKNKESNTGENENDSPDELMWLCMFSKTGLPDRLLDTLSLPQLMGLVCEYCQSNSNNSAVKTKKMSADDIKAFYGIGGK